MSAKNIYHDAVIRALQHDGWTITDDPLLVKVEARTLQIDLGAERDTIGATKGTEKIAVEVSSWLGESQVNDYYRVVGQYLLYSTFLAKQRPTTVLFAGIPVEVADTFLKEPIGAIPIEKFGINILIFDPTAERIVRWKN